MARKSPGQKEISRPSSPQVLTLWWRMVDLPDPRSLANIASEKLPGNPIGKACLKIPPLFRVLNLGGVEIFHRFLMDLHWILGSHWMKVSNSPLLSPENPCLQKAISLSGPGFSGAVDVSFRQEKTSYESIRKDDPIGLKQARTRGRFVTTHIPWAGFYLPLSCQPSGKSTVSHY